MQSLLIVVFVTDFMIKELKVDSVIIFKMVCGCALKTEIINNCILNYYKNTLLMDTYTYSHLLKKHNVGQSISSKAKNAEKSQNFRQVHLFMK